MQSGKRGLRSAYRTMTAGLAVALSLGMATAATAQSFGYANFMAHVRANGVTVKGSGVQSSTRTGLGKYQVEFTRDIRNCFYSATPLGNNGGQVSVAFVGGNDKRLRITTVNRLGALRDTVFFLHVTCNH